MTPAHLEISYRKGRPVAAYLYLADIGPGQAKRTEVVRPGVLLDLDADGRALGVEFVDPVLVTADDVEAVAARVLAGDSLRVELAPLLAA